MKVDVPKLFPLPKTRPVHLTIRNHCKMNLALTGMFWYFNEEYFMRRISGGSGSSFITKNVKSDG